MRVSRLRFPEPVLRRRLRALRLRRACLDRLALVRLSRLLVSLNFVTIEANVFAFGSTFSETVTGCVVYYDKYNSQFKCLFRLRGFLKIHYAIILRSEIIK